MGQTKHIDRQSQIKPRPVLGPLSMSNYFPSGTCYFYGYPAGEDAGFLNKVPPTVEELVAARIFSCGGPHVSVVSFSATNPPLLDANLLDALDIPHSGDTRSILLPKNITHDLSGNERNAAVKTALINVITPGSLVMAQPFMDESMAELYMVSSKLTMWLNDKSNLPALIRSEFLSARLGCYASGADFLTYGFVKSTPCVVKAALSSSGDGVYICRNDDDFYETRQQLKHFKGKIIVESYIEIKNNYCINFGIPHNPDQPIDIIGFNEQLIAANGDFLGGIINTTKLPGEIADITRYMLEVALPAIRAMGWYGVGGLDIITDKTGKAYFIDGNFRMNGTSAYHFLVKNQVIKPPLVTFVGQFSGSREAFERAILPYAGKHAAHKMIRLVALSRHEETWNLNGALMYKDAAQLKRRVDRLLATGIQSAALEQLVT
jgi:hypothetical protein